MIHHTVSVSVASASFLVYFLLTFHDGANAGFFGSSSGSSFGFSSGVSSSSSSGLSSFSSSQSGGARPHDITSKQGLTNLYNSGVASVERVSRPMGGVIGAVGVPHSGVVVTTNSGDRWLVHKGKGYGDSSQTVVTNAKHMSGAWTSGGSQPAQPGTKVADYVKAGGGSYNGVFDNCHDASRRMMNVGKGKR